MLVHGRLTISLLWGITALLYWSAHANACRCWSRAAVTARWNLGLKRFLSKVCRALYSHDRGWTRLVTTPLVKTPLTTQKTLDALLNQGLPISFHVVTFLPSQLFEAPRVFPTVHCKSLSLFSVDCPRHTWHTKASSWRLQSRRGGDDGTGQRSSARWPSRLCLESVWHLRAALPARWYQPPYSALTSLSFRQPRFFLSAQMDGLGTKEPGLFWRCPSPFPPRTTPLP